MASPIMKREYADREKKNKFSRIIVCLTLIAIAGFALRIVNLGSPDIAGDDALYAMRAIGWVDYVAAVNRQSTPVSWFPERQWWQGLSFHDAPPLVFAVQWLFFKIGGVNPWAARLPFVFVGMLAIFAVFLTGRRIGGSWAGLASAAALAVSNYAVFYSRIGLLEGFLILWIALSLYFFLEAEKRPIHYLWWGAVLGAGLATKYTFIFMLPVFLFVLLAWRRDAFRNKWFYTGVALCLLLLSPVIVYNIAMFQARGHPDAALSTLAGQHTADFVGLTRAVSRPANPVAGLVGLAQRNMSAGFLFLFAAGVLIAIRRAAGDKAGRSGYALVILGLGMALATLASLGSADRFGAVMLPFAALLIGLVVGWVGESPSSTLRVFLVVLLAAAFLWELATAIQTQWQPRPFMTSPLLVADHRPVFAGFRLLDKYMTDFYRRFPEPSPIVIFQEEPQLAAYQRERIKARIAALPDGPFQKRLILFDDRMRWFAWVWIFERRRLYDASPIHSIGQFIEKIETRGPEFYTQLGLVDATVIIADDHLLEDAPEPGDKRARFAAALAAQTKPIDEIRDRDGRLLFSVFRLPIASVRQEPVPATRSPR